MWRRTYTRARAYANVRSPPDLPPLNGYEAIISASGDDGVGGHGANYFSSLFRSSVAELRCALARAAPSPAHYHVLPITRII